MTMTPQTRRTPVMPDSSAPSAIAAPTALPATTAIEQRPTSRLILELLRPYRAGLVIVLVAMVVETAMSIAAPWPLKVVLDNAVGHDSLPRWLQWVHDLGLPHDTMGLAAFAGIAAVVIAALGAIASYVDNYFTESVGQWVAHDLRVRIYDHLTRLSLSYYDKEQSGALLSTITVFELLAAGLNIGSIYYRYVEPLTLVGALYFAVTQSGTKAESVHRVQDRVDQVMRQTSSPTAASPWIRILPTSLLWR